MQRPISICKTKNKTARTIFVIRVVFNNLASHSNHLFHLGYTNVSDDTLINSMFGELKFSPLKFGSDFMYLYHVLIISAT
jgi:hypothetical protein